SGRLILRDSDNSRSALGRDQSLKPTKMWLRLTGARDLDIRDGNPVAESSELPCESQTGQPRPNTHGGRRPTVGEQSDSGRRRASASGRPLAAWSISTVTAAIMFPAAKPTFRRSSRAPADVVGSNP